jgi:hypothetical protein
VNVQLRQDALHVLSHHLGRDPQVGSDLLAVTPDDEKLEHPLLLLGQPFDPWRVQSRLLGLARGSMRSEIHYRYVGFEPTKHGMGGQR